MIEFFMSKVWTFIVGAVLLAALLQGVQMRSDDADDLALEQMGERLEELFERIEDSGPGLERTLHMEDYLPLSVCMTICHGYFEMRTGTSTLTFGMPMAELVIVEAEATTPSTSLSLSYSDDVRIITGDDGLTIALLTPRTSRPGI